MARASRLPYRLITKYVYDSFQFMLARSFAWLALVACEGAPPSYSYIILTDQIIKYKVNSILMRLSIQIT